MPGNTLLADATCANWASSGRETRENKAAGRDGRTCFFKSACNSATAYPRVVRVSSTSSCIIMKKRNMRICNDDPFASSLLSGTEELATDNDEDPPAEEGPAAKSREVEPLGADDLLAELLLGSLTELLVEREPDSLDGDVLLSLSLAEGAHDARGEESTAADGDKEVRPDEVRETTDGSDADRVDGGSQDLVNPVLTAAILAGLT